VSYLTSHAKLDELIIAFPTPTSSVIEAPVVAELSTSTLIWISASSSITTFLIVQLFFDVASYSSSFTMNLTEVKPSAVGTKLNSSILIACPPRAILPSAIFTSSDP
jgi:hypothetical protein